MGLENQILGVRHLGITTGKLREDAARYQDKLGFQKIQQWGSRRILPG